MEDFSHIFEGCKSLKEINITNFNNEREKDINYMFSGCSSITSIDLSILNNLSIIKWITFLKVALHLLQLI